VSKELGFALWIMLPLLSMIQPTFAHIILKTFVVIIFGQLVGLVQAQAHEDLGGDGTPMPLPSFVVFLCF
jgi:hypothetical protein